MIEIGPDFRVPPAPSMLQVIFLVLVIAAIAQRIEQDASLGILSARTVFRLTSWFRSTERNAQVGGVPGSLHVQGLGIDVVVDTPLFAPSTDAIEVESLARAWRRFGRQFQAIVESDHLHLELDLAA